MEFVDHKRTWQGCSFSTCKLKYFRRWHYRV